MTIHSQDLKTPAGLWYRMRRCSFECSCGGWNSSLSLCVQFERVPRAQSRTDRGTTLAFIALPTVYYALWLTRLYRCFRSLPKFHYLFYHPERWSSPAKLCAHITRAFSFYFSIVELQLAWFYDHTRQFLWSAVHKIFSCNWCVLISSNFKCFGMCVNIF
jgi:hypothetical protein